MIFTAADTGSLTSEGYVCLQAPVLQARAGWSQAEWATFAASWNRLGSDRYMADGGRYRRRRHAAFAATDQDVRLKPHQPHYQSRDYNTLNGGVQRWFEPVEATVAAGPVLAALFRTLTPLFSALDSHPASMKWHSEVHQFRIEASVDEPGLPTPEGLHRDGVDWVLVMLIARHNVEEGRTDIGDGNDASLGSFTLTRPGDAVLLDDRRVRHGVTAIRPQVGGKPAYRDALVVTWTVPS